MFNGLTIFERIIIESLEKREKKFEDLHNDTCLQKTILANSLNYLLAKTIIVVNKDTYGLNMKYKHLWQADINSPINVELELQEILESLLKLALKHQGKDHLKIKKVTVGESDRIILKAMLRNVEAFINNLGKKKQTRLEKTSDQQIVVWGLATYNELLKEI